MNCMFLTHKKYLILSLFTNLYPFIGVKNVQYNLSICF